MDTDDRFGAFLLILLILLVLVLIGGVSSCLLNEGSKRTCDHRSVQVHSMFTPSGKHAYPILTTTKGDAYQYGYHLHRDVKFEKGSCYHISFCSTGPNNPDWIEVAVKEPCL